MDVDFSLPFGRFLRIAIADIRKERGGVALDAKGLEEEIDRAHDAWHRARKKKKKGPVTDAQWSADLVVDFTGVDIQAQHQLASVWAKRHERKFTRKFFENWLMKELRLVQANGHATLPAAAKEAGLSVYKEPASEWRGIAQELLGDVPLAEWIRDGRPWADVPVDLRRRIVGRLSS